MKLIPAIQMAGSLINALLLTSTVSCHCCKDSFLILPQSLHFSWSTKADRAQFSDNIIDGDSNTCASPQSSWIWFSTVPISHWNQPWIRIKLFEFVAVHSVSVVTGEFTHDYIL